MCDVTLLICNQKCDLNVRSDTAHHTVRVYENIWVSGNISINITICHRWHSACCWTQYRFCWLSCIDVAYYVEVYTVILVQYRLTTGWIAAISSTVVNWKWLSTSRLVVDLEIWSMSVQQSVWLHIFTATASLLVCVSVQISLCLCIQDWKSVTHTHTDAIQKQLLYDKLCKLFLHHQSPDGATCFTFYICRTCWALQSTVLLLV